MTTAMSPMPAHLGHEHAGGGVGVAVGELELRADEVAPGLVLDFGVSLAREGGKGLPSRGARPLTKSVHAALRVHHKPHPTGQQRRTERSRQDSGEVGLKFKLRARPMARSRGAGSALSASAGSAR